MLRKRGQRSAREQRVLEDDVWQVRGAFAAGATLESCVFPGLAVDPAKVFVA